MESSQAENVLAMKEKVAAQNPVMPDIESKVCCNGTVKDAGDDGDESQPSREANGSVSKDSSPPPLSPVSLPSDDGTVDNPENGVDKTSDPVTPGSVKDDLEKSSNSCEDKSHNNETEESTSVVDAVVENHVIADSSNVVSNDKGEENQLEDEETEKKVDGDSNSQDLESRDGISKEVQDTADIDIPVLEKSVIEEDQCDVNGKCSETSSLDSCPKPTEELPGDDRHLSDELKEFTEGENEVECMEENSEPPPKGDESLDKIDKETVKEDIFHEKAQSIPAQIFEDITEDEDSEDESFENIELELDDLIDPSEVSKSSGSSDRFKSGSQTPKGDIEMIDEIGNNDEISKNSSQGDENSENIKVGSSFGTSKLGDEQNSENKVASDLNTPSEEAGGRGPTVKDIERPKSCNAVIDIDSIENKDNDRDVTIIKQPALEISTAADKDKCVSAPVRKPKFTARKSGKPVSQTEMSLLKTINLHPIKNITMNVSDIEGALDFVPLKETDSSKSSKLSDTSDHSDTAVHQGEGNSGGGAGKTSLGGKKKRRKNTYDFPGCKKKPKRTRWDEHESVGSSADSVSLSDGDFPDLDSCKDPTYLLKGSVVKGSKTESALDVLTKNSHLGFSKKPKNSLLHSSSASPSSSSSSLLASGLSVGKGNSKMKTVLDMLHEKSRQKAEEKKATSSTTTTTVSVTSSATTTTTTILVSPPPNKTIVEGVKRKGTPRKRREEVICLSDSDESDGKKKVVVEGKRKRDSFDNSTSLSSVPVSSPSAPPVPSKPRLGVPTTQSPVVMVVAQHSAAPGLRSLLPRHALVSGSSKMVQPTGSLFSSFPLISTLPAGAKAISVGSLPAGVTAVPITSLPAGSQQAMTFFTTVPGSVGPGVPIPISGANLVNISQPKLPPNNTTPSKSIKIPTSSTPSSSSSLSKTTAASPAQSNSDSLRALLVGKPYTFNRVTSTTPQLSTTPMLFQMMTTSGASLVPVPSQPLTLTPSSMIPGMLKPMATAPCTKSSYSLIKPHPPHVPNGVSCLTPPKTPDTDSSSEVAVAASLSRPVAGQVEDSEVIPLCCCKINGASFNKLFSGVTYCQALDTVDSKVLGCCNKVTNPQLVRPGVKIPFMAVCEVHRKRLKLHQCCPGCGHFCSQGKFQQCRKEGKSSVHNFHKQCVFYRGGKYYCPHCGEETSRCEVELRLNEEKPEEAKVVVSRLSRKELDKKTARMGSKDFVKSRSTNEAKEKTLTLSNNKHINIGALPLGPEHQILTRLSRCTGEDRPKKYRTLPKDLYTPASEGDIEKVFYLLMDGMDPNVRYENFEDQTAVHAAAVSGSLGTVFILQQFGAEIHAQDKNLRTPMMCAAENGNLKVVQFLIKSGARVEDRGEDGMTSLHYAAKSGYLDIIQHILETDKLDVNIQDDGGWTAITWATENQLVDAVKYLVKQGGDPNKKDNEENTGLHWAAFAGSLEIAEIYLDIGCELDSPNEHGDRPLHIAARQDHYDIVVLLLARGADVDTKNNKDETPVESCSNKNGQVWMALKVNQQLRSFAARKLIQPERLLERDITMGREKNPIACVNSEDKEPCPTDFLYVVENVETSPLNVNYVITSLQSCRCKDDCSSMYCVCARSSIKCWYDKMGRMLEEVNLLEPPLVFECNRACRCWVNCNNRVVQNGITCRLQLFRTNGRGWGVRTLMDIPKGTFVCEYIGELISDSEADRREDDSYLFDLDNKDGDTYCIDARKYGNISRFINHLCEPNLIPVKVFVEHQDLRFPRICLFSSREIKAYEELGFDYGEKFWMIKWKHFTCACKSNKCKYSSDTIKKTLADYKLRYPDEQVDA